MFFLAASLICYLLIVIFIGSRMRALGNIMHECVHGVFASSPQKNLICGHFIAILLFECFSTYRQSHFLHHRLLGHPSKDVDYIQYKKIKSNISRSNRVNIVVSLLNPYHWFLMLKNNVFIFAKNHWIKCFKIIYLILILTCLYYWPKAIFLYGIVPYLTSYQAFKIFSDIVDHDLIYEAPDLNDRARNHIFASSMLNWLIFPRHDAYHLVHHLYPRLPVAEYKSRHHFLLKNNSAYAAKNHSCDLQKFSHSGIQG